MPKGSLQLVKAREEEILKACEKLYETMSFKEITIKEIGNATSLTRTSIYNYFQTKEEIFLTLLIREYNLWIDSLKDILNRHETLSREEFAKILAHSLEKRELLLKIMSMNLYDLESNCNLESVVKLKEVYGESMQIVRECLSKFFPDMNAKDKEDFIFAFFPFMLGVYPYVVASDIQKEAMVIAQVNYVHMSIYELVYNCVRKLLD